LSSKLQEMLNGQIEVPMIIDGEEVRNGNLADIRCPHNHQHVLGKYHQADGEYAIKAIDAAQKAKKQWGQMPWESRAVVLLKAAELLAGKYRQTLNAATMLNTSKTPHQAEIDAACELIDFWRFNPHFMEEVYGDQPMSSPGILNYMEHRPLDGYVLAITPFNFASIAGNLPTAPALMGNTVVWKPASAAGNFYVNDKPTGAVVAQQPFGGTRASGTNDKAGSWLNLERWVSPRAIKETFLPPRNFRYPYMAE